MNTKELKVSIKVTVPRSVVDEVDGPYFYNIGFEKEEFVKKNEVENGIEAWFEGFELLANADTSVEEDMVTAKLHYMVVVDTSKG